MNYRLIIAAFCLVTSYGAFAQQLSKEDADREKKFQEKAVTVGKDTAAHFGWTHALSFGANVTQVTFKDWASGGENSLAYALLLAGASIDNSETFQWGNSYKFSFGQARLGNEGVRKTDDEIYFESLLIYKLNSTVNPYASATMRTQFAKGFTYDDTGKGTAISKFFDPAYLTQSVGMIYLPTPELKTRLGLALREMVTSTFTQYTDDPTTPEIEKTRVEGGFESVTEGAWSIAENMTYATRLELFDPAKHMDRMYVRSDNTLTAKVNKLLNVSLTVQVINDVNMSPRTQFKEVLAIGFNFAIL